MVSGPVVQCYNGTVALTSSGTIAAGSVINVASAYKTTDYALVVNGAAAITAASPAVNTANTLRIGDSTGSNAFNGHIKSILYRPRRVANADMQAETTP